MKLSNLVFAAAGYTLGARAGRERYEDIVRWGRRFAGSQTVQSTAGIVQAQVDRYVHQARQAVADHLATPPGAEPSPAARTMDGAAVNGHHH